MFGLKKFFKRSSPENPSTSIGSWIMGWGGASSLSGVNVTQDNSLGITALWRAVKLLGEGVASLQLDVVREDSEGNKSVDKNHPIYKLLHNPSPLYTKTTLFEAAQADIELRGNCFLAIKRDPITDRPQELRRIDPDRFKEVNTREDEVIYTFWNEKTTGVVSFFGSDLIHVPSLALTSEGIIGKSPLEVHRETLGLNLATILYGAKFFKNGAHIQGYLTTDQVLNQTQKENLKSSWKINFSGIENTGSTPILEGGLKFQNISLSPQDARFIETHRLNVEEIARIFGIPPHLLGSLERATFSNIENQSREYVSYALRPRVKRWEDELRRKLLTSREQGRVFVKFNLDSLLRGNTVDRAKYLHSALQNGWMTINEVRKIEGLNRIEGGDELRLPLNMSSVKELEEEKIEQEN